MGDSREFAFFKEYEEKAVQPVYNPRAGRPQLLLGAIPFSGSLNAKDTARVINEWYDAVGNLHIDGAYMYGNEEATSSRIPAIASTLLQCKISTKVTPMFVDNDPDHPFGPAGYPNKTYLGLTPESIRKQLSISLRKLGRDCVEILYLHWMDIGTNIEVTLQCVDALYQQGKFRRFGLSNFYAWQVAQIVQICRDKGYVRPTVYEGHYNPICRDIETELLPCLRYFGLDFYAFGMLANGLLAGSYLDVAYRDSEELDLSANRMGGYFSKQLYWRKSYFEAFEIIKQAADEVYGKEVNYSDLSMRWMVHHSQLGANDGIICGVSKYKYLKQTIDSLQYGEPLDDRLVQAFNKAWLVAKKETRGYLQWSTENGIIRSDDPFILKGLRARL